MDLLIGASHVISKDYDYPERYTDVHDIERDRCVSIKAMPMSLVMQNLKGKSFVMNVMDTPGTFSFDIPTLFFIVGHVDFADEVTASIRIADGAILVVDAVEGVMVNTERMIKHLAAEKIPMVVVVNKIDRLIVELKLPPRDAYFKLKHTIEEINSILAQVYPHF